MKKVIILILTLFLSFFFIEKNTPVKAEGVPMLGKTGEISKIQVVDSVGRFEKISNKKYKYTYFKLSYNEEFEYYYHPNATTEIIELSLSEMPKIAFDSNENLINCYFSINNNYWYKCDVENKTEKRKFNWTYEKVSNHSFDIPNYTNSSVYFEIYFNFDFQFDTIFEVSFNLPVYLKSAYFNKNVFVSNFECCLKFDDCVSILNTSFIDMLNFSKYGLFFDSKLQYINKPLIECSKFEINGKNYNCKCIFVDKEYYLFDANRGLFESELMIGKWKDGSYFGNHPTIFNSKYFVSSNDKDPNVEDKTMFADCVFSYKGVIFKIENMEGVQDYDKDHPMADSRNWLQKLLDKIFPDIGRSINIILICVIILFVILLVVYIVSKIRQNKLLKYQIKNEKTNSYRGGFNDK